MDKPIPEAVLVPCPMCGGRAALNTCRTTEREFIRLNGRDTGHGVNCVDCGLNNRGFSYGYATAAEAIAAWNRRALTAAQQQGQAVDEAIDEPWLSDFLARGNRLVRALYNDSRDSFSLSDTGDWMQTAMGYMLRTQPMQQGGGEVVAELTLTEASEGLEWPDAPLRLTESGRFRLCAGKHQLYTAPPSAPVGVEGGENWRQFVADVNAALAQQPAAVDELPDCPHSALDGCDCYATQHQEPTT